MGTKRVRLALVEAYSDESGNSGSNLFDPAQPWFWTGTLIARGNIQALAAPLVRDLGQRLGVSELHGKDLGLPRIEAVAPDLQAFLESVQARIVFTALEKAHVASTKLVDTVLDSDTNKGVSPLHYAVRGLRLPLAHVIVECMTRQDQEDFWEVYRTRDGRVFCDVLRRIDATFRSRVQDARLKEILGDAFAWAISHPLEVLDFKRSEDDAPNMIAFSLLIDGIHAVLEGTTLRVHRFVHDDQQQFGRFMHKWFPALSRITMGTHATTVMTDLRKIDIIRCKIELASSKSTPGLQLIDVILWLYRRSMTNPLRDFPASARLVEFIAANGVVHEFSRSQLAGSARQTMDELAAVDISAVDPSRVQAFGEKLEQQRLQRMGPDLRVDDK